VGDIRGSCSRMCGRSRAIFSSGSGITWRDTCEQVTAAEIPVNKVPRAGLRVAPELPELPPLPGNIAHSLAVGQCQEARNYAKLVILDDGFNLEMAAQLFVGERFRPGVCYRYGMVLGAIGGSCLSGCGVICGRPFRSEDRNQGPIGSRVHPGPCWDERWDPC